MAYSEFLPTHLNPLAERTCFSQVVYAGAAPGCHTPLLADMFPAVDFVLVDPVRFDSRLEGHPRVELRRGLFTAEMAAEFAGRDDVLFVSDIRTMPNDDAHCAADMALQQAWVLQIQPLACMLKFRLPWAPGGTEYLDGRVFLQPYAQTRSTESRLIWERGDGQRCWDHTEYEEQMFAWNTGAV